mgnify:CR=1 FL=1|tara:strand:- start:308 stop:886 length:579 start_codon:yes stop_codon:yes gene_type:complete
MGGILRNHVLWIGGLLLFWGCASKPQPAESTTVAGAEPTAKPSRVTRAPAGVAEGEEPQVPWTFLSGRFVHYSEGTLELEERSLTVSKPSFDLQTRLLKLKQGEKVKVVVDGERVVDVLRASAPPWFHLLSTLAPGDRIRVRTRHTREGWLSFRVEEVTKEGLRLQPLVRPGVYKGHVEIPRRDLVDVEPEH